MTGGEFINTIATQVGISQDDATLKTLLSNGALSTVTVPDELVTKFNDHYKDLFTIESAKQNPEIKKYFSAMALNIVDTELEKTAEQMGLDKEVIKEIYGKEQYTNKRVAAIARKLEEVIKAKNATPAGDDKKHEKLTAEITGLNAQILTIQAEHEKKNLENKGEYTNKLRKYKENEFFNSYDYTDELPKKVQAISARNLSEDAITQHNYKVVFDEESGNLRLLTAEDTEVFKNNKPVTYKDFNDALLAENKMLKVTKTVLTPEGKKTPIQIAIGDRNTSKMTEALNESAKAFESVS